MKWHDHLVQCENVKSGKRCTNSTHFREWELPDTDTLRRKRKGFCIDCWDEFKKTPEYQKMLDEYKESRER